MAEGDHLRLRPGGRDRPTPEVLPIELGATRIQQLRNPQHAMTVFPIGLKNLPDDLGLLDPPHHVVVGGALRDLPAVVDRDAAVPVAAASCIIFVAGPPRGRIPGPLPINTCPHGRDPKIQDTQASEGRVNCLLLM